MNCPKCNSNKCHVINQVTTKGTDFSASKGCLGWICFGPIGLLCGACGKGKQIVNTQYWVCDECGKKWKA